MLVRTHRQVEGQPCKKPKKDGDKSAVAILKNVRQLGFVFLDTEPPESLPFLRKRTNVLVSIRRVRFTEASQRHAHIRDNKGPSVGKIQVKVPHQRSPYALKFLRIGLRRRSRRRVEIGPENLKAQRNGQSYLLLTYQ